MKLDNYYLKIAGFKLKIIAISYNNRICEICRIYCLNNYCREQNTS